MELAKIVNNTVANRVKVKCVVLMNVLKFKSY